MSLRRDEAEYRRLLSVASNINNPELRPPLERMRQNAAAFAVWCFPGDDSCVLSLANALAQQIDLALAGQQPEQIAARQMEQYRTNLAALRCDERVTATNTAQPAAPSLSGTDANVVTIRGRYYNLANYRYYQVAQEGVNFTFRSEDGAESGSGTITVWPMYQRLTAIVTGPDGTRNISGIIEMSGTDRTRVWQLGWYMGYGPWQRSQ